MKDSMKDLLTRLDSILAEGSVAPGEKKALSFKIQKLEKMKKKIEEYQQSLYSVKAASLPRELEKEQNQLADKIAVFLEKIEREYDELNKKSTGNGDTPIKLENLLKGIKKNCSQILKVYQQINNKDMTSGNFIFRGINSTEDALYGMPYNHRRAKDSDQFIHKLADDYMKRIGIKARRTNSIFTTSDKNQASQYGKHVYIIFPVDGFDFCYSKNIKDLVLTNYKYLDTFLNYDVVDEIKGIVTKTWEEASEGDSIKHVFNNISSIDDLLTTYNKHIGDMDKLTNLVEKGVLPKKVGSLLDQVYTENDKPKEIFDFDDNDIYGAILSKHEIYINGKYYAIRSDYLKEIRKFITDLDLSDVELPEKYGKAPEGLMFVNDIVKVIRGSNAGKIGIVYNILPQQVDIKTSYDGSSIFYDIPYDGLEVVDQSVQNKWKWKRGDEVIPTSEDSPFCGYTGEVVEIKDDEPAVGVKFDKPDNTSRYFYNFELVKSTPETQKKYEKLRNPTFQLNDRVVVIDQNSPFYQFTGTISYIYTYSPSPYEVTIDRAGKSPTFKARQLGLESENKDKVKEPIGSGDTVLIKKKGSVYDGELGVIIAIYNDGETSVQLLKGNTAYIDLNYLFKHVQEAQIETDIVEGSVVTVISGDGIGLSGVVIDKEGDSITLKFPMGGVLKTTVSNVKLRIIKDSKGNAINIGDIVTVNNPTQETEDGDFVVSRFTYKNVYKNVYFRVELVSESGKSIMAAPDDITVVSTKMFKKGDKVKIIAGNLAGVEGVVTGNTAIYVKVDTPDGEMSYYEDELEPIIGNEKEENTENLPMPGQKFQIGDTVKVINPDSMYVGKIGKVTSMPKEGLGYGVKFPDAYSNIHFDHDELELVPEQKSSSFKHNDIVEINESPFIANGTLGMVISEDPLLVRILEGDKFGKEFSFGATNLTKIPTYRVGEKVKVINQKLSSFGKTGVILENMGGSLFLVKMDDIAIIVKESSIKRIPNKTTPQPTNTDKIQVGDKVKVNSTWSSLHGKVGTVQAVGDIFADVVIPPDGPEHPTTLELSQLIKIGSNTPDVPTSTKIEIGDIVEVDPAKYPQYAGKKYKVKHMTEDQEVLLIYDLSNQDKGLISVGADEVKKVS